MIKIEKLLTPTHEQWEAVIRGMRNPLNSWEFSDSTYENELNIGEKDLNLMNKLAKAGTSHSKYRRMLVVYLDITAPMYWWSEYDTYKVGTVANSCSKMHKLMSKPFEMSDFSIEHLIDLCVFDDLIKDLNYYRNKYLKTNNKQYWWQVIQTLPTSYNQKRTVMLNYEVLANIYKDRKDHKLNEWKDFCEFIKTLPYNEIIIGETK